ITDEVFNIHSFCKPLEGKILYTRGDTTNIGDLYIYDIKSKKEDKLTNCNSWLDDINLNAPIKFTVRSKDGKANIQGWVYKPIDFDENKKYPAILEIHGGPSIYTASDFCFEYHRLAAEGMVVLAPDVRGSAGYGEKFMDGRYAWSNEAFDDFMSYIDCAAEEFPYIDLDKLGVTGGSYGGYMTNKIIGLSDRFKAAVTQRTLINKGVSYGAGDIGFVSTGEDGPPEFPKCDSSLLVHFYNRLKTSPICNIDNIKLPLLILHGDKDYRCDLQQADQIFTAMKDRHPDIPCKLVIFKDENHGITRIGKIHNQMGHLHEMTEWFKKYLFTKEV
ncbi:MAG: alpha/beta hydrolase family protein, partial [Intestinibacter sp.]|uniref:alpha/beta hydrolase family protein n=1 Tax=Intestinibacter sp. TaxID=1965304 RepID=UPI003F17AC04